MANWTEFLPASRGTLPEGQPLRRTDPSGECRAKIAFLGAYPAATAVRQVLVSGKRLNLAVEVEGESFAPESASGREFESHYLEPLGLIRADVLVTDMLPYYLANTTASGTEGRSMADNVRAYEAVHGPTGIAARLPPEELVALARHMRGNLDRLLFYFEQHKPTVLFTLGAEAAAFVRGTTHSEVQRQVDDLLYSAPQRAHVFGRDVSVVHLVHPHLFIKRNEKWMTRHEAWCEAHGRALVSSSVAATSPASVGAPT